MRLLPACCLLISALLVGFSYPGFAADPALDDETDTDSDASSEDTDSDAWSEDTDSDAWSEDTDDDTDSDSDSGVEIEGERPSTQLDEAGGSSCSEAGGSGCSHAPLGAAGVVALVLAGVRRRR